MDQSHQAWLSPIEDVIQDAQRGRMFILIDDEGRENEGDLVIPAQMADAEAVNFMARHGRGLICLALSRERVEELGLPPMASRNRSPHQTAFTVSIEAAEGVTTGISAADRAHTIAVAIDPTKGRGDLVTPGHIFPLVAQDGGVLVRAGHTEAAVDISRLAGLHPSGVICEIMNDDGTMARLPDLVAFGRKHNLKIATIEELIAYRRRNERLVERIASTTLQSRFGGRFDLHVYANKISYAEHVALVCGSVGGDDPVLVRMHRFDVLADALGDVSAGVFSGREGGAPAGELEASMRLVAEQGRGVVVVIREGTQTGLSRAVKERDGMAAPKPTAELRQYGIGAQILLDLGIRNIILLSNTKRTIVGLDGYGLHLVGQQAVPTSSR